MGYISAGTKLYRQREGIAAEFCPICRRATGVEVLQIRSQPHVYHIGIGQGDLVGRLCRCLDCACEWAFQEGTIERSINPAEPVTLPVLLAETFPRFETFYAARLTVERTIRRDPRALDAQLRASLLVEPFLILDNEIQNNERETSGGQMLLGLGCLVFLGLGLGSLIAFVMLELWWGIGLFLACLWTGWLSWWQYELGVNRFLKSHIYPRLARGLAPLNPTEDELKRIKAEGEAKSAARMKIADFLPVLAAERAARFEIQPPPPGAEAAQAQ